MQREIEEKITNWLLNDNKALLIEGARQVGKTYIIRKILKDNNITYAEFNLIDNVKVLESIKNANDAKTILEKIELYSDVTLKKHESVIFLDEIQEFPEIVTKIKFLVDEGSYKYILSGSLLGIELKGIKSVPVGYLNILRLYPMNFFEFILALGVKESIIQYIKECVDELKPIDEVIHNKMLSLFSLFLAVGGMPSVVQKFIIEKNMQSVDTEAKNIINMYKADFSKYESEDRKLRIIEIYNNIPSQLNKGNNKFIFTILNKQLKFNRYENSFLWLKDAGVALPTYIASELKSPLVQSKDRNSFKLFLSDVGLLTASYPSFVREDIISNKLSKYNMGGLFENYACQELMSNGFDVYYFKNIDIGELDFVIEKDGKVVAIEIKSGKDYQKHNSLDKVHLLNQEIERIVFSNNNIKKEGVVYLPIYTIGLIKNTSVNNKTIDVQLP